MHRSATPERLGAHVSIQGGVDTAPARGLAIGATAIQVFTKTPNQWREPTLGAGICAAFRRAVEKSGLRAVISHDSYLINLASPDPPLSASSVAAFSAELRRCRGPRDPPMWCRTRATTSTTGKPGSPAMPRRTPAASGRCPAPSWSCSRRLPAPAPPWAAPSRSSAPSATLSPPTSAAASASAPTPATSTRPATTWWATTTASGTSGTACSASTRSAAIHLNDSKTPFGSHRDRHELIGEGILGPEPFRWIMRDPRFDPWSQDPRNPKGETIPRRWIARCCADLGAMPGPPAGPRSASAPRRADLDAPAPRHPDRQPRPRRLGDTDGVRRDLRPGRETAQPSSQHGLDPERILPNLTARA